MKPRFIAGLEPTISGAIMLDSCARSGRGDNRDFVFQSDNLLPWRTVFSIAIIGPEVAGRLSDKKRQRTLGLLKLMGLGGFENYNPRQLAVCASASISRSRAIDPELLLMNEPFSSLDTQTREIMQAEPL